MEKRTLTLGSLFDGSGGFPLGGILAGIRPVWSSEIEPFPVLVTRRRLPSVKHYGDVSKLSGHTLEPVDIITFGSPCQDLSIAGKRAGIHEGERSNLFFEAIRIVKEMREETNGEKPRYIVWENVPGAFSSNRGDDFRAVLEAVIGVKEEGVEVPAPSDHRWPKADVYLGDGWSLAYRVLDAQYWGVPQRRARIYLVADFAGEGAPEVLFKSEGLSGYTPEGFRPWKRTAAGAEEGAGAAGTGPGAGSDGGDGRDGESGGDGRYCLNPQGCSGVTVTEEQTGTLVAQDHGNHPAVLQAAGFSTEHSANARSIGYEEEKSPTLRAGVVPAAMAVENHPTDSRVKISEDGKVQTLCSRMGTGGNNVPLVAEVEPVVFAKGTKPHSADEAPTYKRADVANTLNTFDTGEVRANELVAEPVTLKMRSGKPGGGKGSLTQVNKSATLGCNNDQALFQPSSGPGRPSFTGSGNQDIRAFGVCSKSSHAMLSDNPHSGFYEAETSRTLDVGGGNPTCNQGGICIVSPDPAFALQGSMIGRKEKNGPQGDGVNEEVSFTLTGADHHAVAMPSGKHYSASKNSFFMHTAEEQANTLVATDYKDPPILNDAPNDEPLYIVRRLTPVECARLQGFPDWWCDGLGDPDPSEEEVSFWAGVWNEWQRVTGKKPKTEKQVRRWLADPYTDSAAYKLWGNGVAECNVYFVLCGIAWNASRDGIPDGSVAGDGQ